MASSSSSFLLPRVPGYRTHRAPIFEKLTKTSDRWLIVAAWLLFSTDALGGINRWLLASAHLAPLIYLPLLTIAGATVLSIIVQLRSEEPALVLGAVLVGLFLDILLSLLVGRSLLEVVFALYTFLPWFFGMKLGQRRLERAVLVPLAVLFVISAVGVIANRWVTYPWSGATYQIGGAEVGMARDWSAGGVARLPGFSRASFVAASYLLFGLIAYCRYDRSKIRMLLAYLAAFFGIYVTTSKTQLVLVAILPLMWIITRQGRSRLWFARLIVSCLAILIMIGLPFASYLSASWGTYDVIRGRIPDSSFVDRYVNTWPNAFDLITRDNSPLEYLIGRGLGGIGSAQKLFDNYWYNPADNLPAFLYVTWGFSCLLILALLIRRSFQAARGQTISANTFWMISVGLLGCGATTTVIENPSMSILLGYLLGTRLKPRLANESSSSTGGNTADL